MAYEGDRRITIYNLVASALTAKLFFGKVSKQLPESPPAGMDTLPGKPQAFVALLPETMTGITNKERESDFRIAVILLVRADKDVDLEKLRAQNVAERAINNLQVDANFTAVGSIIHIQNIDPGPLALSVYGLNWEILPPFGVVRLDVLANFIYQAID